MFEQFPYTDMHQLNLDWIIKIAKDFLDQYTSIQQMIEDGEQSLNDATQEGLNDLQEKADTLQGLLDAWYTEHSTDIANQLADALQDLNEWYTTHENYLNQALQENLTAFNQQAALIAQQVIGTIPQDYTALSNAVDTIFDPAALNAHLKDDCAYILQWNDTYGYVELNATSLVIMPGGSYGYDMIVDLSLFPEYYNARTRIFSNIPYSTANMVSYTDTHDKIVTLPKDTYWTLEISKMGNAQCAVSETKYIAFYPSLTTDKTLSIENMPADAKTVGDIVKTAFKTSRQYFDSALWEHNYYWNWFNNVMTKGDTTGDFATYPPIVLDPGTYTLNINPLPSYFCWLDINGTVSALNTNTTLNQDGTYSFTIPSSGGTLYMTLNTFTERPYTTYMLVNNSVIPATLVEGVYSVIPAWLNPSGVNIFTVGKGCQFETISSACAAASADDIILIMPGIYDEDVSIFGKKLHLVGFNKALCKLVNHTANYDTPPLEMNIGSLSNMTIIADGTNPDPDMPTGKDHTQYCLHIESGVNANGETFEIYNCNFINEFHACIGCGLYQGLTVRFRYCTFRSNGYNQNYPRGAFYYHSNTGEATQQKMIVEHCVISSAYQEVIHAGAPGTASGMCSSRFNNNVINSDATADETLMVYNEFWKPHFKLDTMSANNTVKILNGISATDGFTTVLENIPSTEYSSITNAYNKLYTGRAYMYAAYADSTTYSVGLIFYIQNDVKLIELENSGCNVTCANNGTIYVWNRSNSTKTYRVTLREIG